MMSEIMIPVDPKCIPDGWEPLRFGIPKEGEFIIPLTQWGGGDPVRVQPKEVFSTPRLIVRKKYDPGIRIKQGWSVWNNDGDWVASPKCRVLAEGVYGIQQLPGFVPPPDGQPRQIT
jgi:hypothetical protein